MTPAKSRLFVLTTGLVTLPAAFMFAVEAALPHVFVVAGALFLLSLATAKAVPFNHRSVIYTLLFALVLAAFSNLVFPMDNNRFSFPRYLFRTNVSAPFLVFLAGACLFFRSGGRALGVCAACSFLVNMMCGDALPKGDGSMLFGNLIATKDKLGALFQAVAIVELGGLLLALKSLGRFRRAPGGGRRGAGWKLAARALACLAILAALVAGLEARKLYLKYEKQLLVHEKLFSKLLWGNRGNEKVFFASEADLNQTLSPEFLENARLPLLRVYGATPPGYLRGRAYSRYHNGVWSAATQPGPNLNLSPRDGILTYNTFSYDGHPGPPQALFRAYPTMSYGSDIVFAPGGAWKFELVAANFKADVNGSLTASEWERDGGYYFHAPPGGQESAYPLPKDPPGAYTQTPPSLDAFLDSYLRDELGLAADTRLPDAAKVDKLVAHFLKNFKYELKRVVPGPRDPVERFLGKDGRSGHCELFAASATLLLRRLGVPARYVTGLVCEERQSPGGYYLARLGDAHAWTEAYPRESGQWTLVDATPPSGTPRGSEWRAGLLERYLDNLKAFFQQVLADMRRGRFAEAILFFFGSLLRLFLRPWGVAALLLAGVAAALWLRGKRRRKLAAGPAYALSAQAKALNQELRAVEAVLARRCRAVRAESETVLEFARRLQGVRGVPPPALEFLFRYPDPRYSPAPASAAELEELRRLRGEITK